MSFPSNVAITDSGPAIALADHDGDSQLLPPVLFSFATHNEDPCVELELLQLMAERKQRQHGDRAKLRIAYVAGCGTHAIAMASSPHVASIDAIDKEHSQVQVMVAALVNAAAATLDSPAALASFIGCGGGAAERRATYPSTVRPGLTQDVAEFWDGHVETAAAGLLQCGGCERMWGVIRAALPTRDAQQLAAQPEAADEAVRAGVTRKTMEAYIKFLPPHLIDELTPVVADMFSTMFTQLLATFAATGITSWMLHFILTGRYALSGDATPIFLQPDVFAAAQRHGIDALRLRFHVGKLQDKAVQLAQREGRFDVIGLSNILQANKAEAYDAVQSLKEAVAPGGALLCRGAGAAGVFEACELHVEAELNAKLQQLDLPHWNEVVVGFV